MPDKCWSVCVGIKPTSHHSWEAGGRVLHARTVTGPLPHTIIHVPSLLQLRAPSPKPQPALSPFSISCLGSADVWKAATAPRGSSHGGCPVSAAELDSLPSPWEEASHLQGKRLQDATPGCWQSCLLLRTEERKLPGLMHYHVH
ncbi:uncharacterized protein VSU04_008424 isoform 1-T1 [Chlamydotis macqueenii]